MISALASSSDCPVISVSSSTARSARSSRVCTPPSASLVISSRVEAFEVAQVLGDRLDAFFLGDFHGQQRILGARTQLVDGVFVKAFDLQHFLQRHVGHFFQAGEALGNQDVGDFLVHIELFHEQRAA